jgi:hypothetical protein
MATDVSRQVATVKWILQTALTKTLAYKHRLSVAEVFHKYRAVTADGYLVLRVTVERTGKAPLVAEFGGFPLARVPEGMSLTREFVFDAAWRSYSNRRSELVQRLLHGVCELCGATERIEVHHIRGLKDLERPGRRPKAGWEYVMASRRRKTLVLCEPCHDAIHNGRYDGPRLK